MTLDGLVTLIIAFCGAPDQYEAGNTIVMDKCYDYIVNCSVDRRGQLKSNSEIQDCFVNERKQRAETNK